MEEKVAIYIKVDKEFADLLYYMKKQFYGREKGAQAKTIEDALIALAKQSKFELALEKMQKAQEEIEELKKDVEQSKR